MTLSWEFLEEDTVALKEVLLVLDLVRGGEWVLLAVDVWSHDDNTVTCDLLSDGVDEVDCSTERSVVEEILGVAEPADETEGESDTERTAEAEVLTDRGSVRLADFVDCEMPLIKRRRWLLYSGK